MAGEFGSLDTLMTADLSGLQAAKAELQKRNVKHRAKGEPVEAVPLEGVGVEIIDSLHGFLAEPNNRDAPGSMCLTVSTR